MRVANLSGLFLSALLLSGAAVAAQTDTPTVERDAPPETEAVSLIELMVPGPLGEKSLGDATAPVTVVEYASMTCPHCAEFHTTVYPDLKKKYIDTGKVRFVFREFPLDALSTAAFMIARCAPEEQYFSAVETMFARQNDWAFVDQPMEKLFSVVQPFGFDEAKFGACLRNQDVLNGVNAVGSRGMEQFGVDGTPTFFINGARHGGGLTIEQIDELVEPLL